MTDIIKIGLHKPTGQFMHVDKASNGLSCDCECLKCGEKLEAIQGEIRAKHFRHYTDKDCDGSQETALHELGKQILIENTQVQIPQFGLISYTEPVAEKRLEKIRPDVTAKYSDQSVHFEIFVSHMVEDKKDNFIKEKQLRCVEIDISDEKTSTYEEIKRKVLETVENKRIIFWETEKVQQTNNESNGCMLQFLVLIGVFLGLAWFISKR